MNAPSPLSAATSIEWSKPILEHIAKLGLLQSEIEEVLLNFPSVRQITQEFPDHFVRYVVNGTTDREKHLEIVLYVEKHKIHITYVNRTSTY